MNVNNPQEYLASGTYKKCLTISYHSLNVIGTLNYVYTFAQVNNENNRCQLDC